MRGRCACGVIRCERAMELDMVVFMHTQAQTDTHMHKNAGETRKRDLRKREAQQMGGREGVKEGDAPLCTDPGVNAEQEAIKAAIEGVANQAGKK